MPAYVSFLTALGWSLLDSIWQMAVLWTAYYFLTAGNKRISAAGKHNLAFMFVAMGSGWFIYSFIHLLNEPALPLIPGFIPGLQQVNRWVPFLSLVYLLIFILRFIQYGLQHFAGNKDRSPKSISVVLQSFVDIHARLLGVSRRVDVYLSEMAETAQTSGFFKPLILLPVSLVTRLSAQQLEAILVHELFHIRRNDYLINIFMSGFRSIFYFNPFAHFFYKAITRERELACDDGVLEREYPPALYAEALFSLEKFRQTGSGFSLAADGNKPWLLMERIRRVLGKPTGERNRFNPMFFLSLFGALILFGMQQKTSPRRDAAVVSTVRTFPVQSRFEFAKENITNKETGITVRVPIHRKSPKKPCIHPLPPISISYAEIAAETNPLNQIYFAENNPERDYSNQQAAGMNNDLVQAVPGTPFVPSMSLSYEALPEVMAADSFRDMEIQNGMKEMTNICQLKEIAELNRAASEMERNRELLREAETRNRVLIQWDQKKIKPLLENIHQQMRVKKQKIDRLRIKLQTSEEEIIHI